MNLVMRLWPSMLLLISGCAPGGGAESRSGRPDWSAVQETSDRVVSISGFSGPEAVRFVLAPWGGGRTVRAWRPDDGALEIVGTLPGGRFDGVEPYGERWLFASQADSSILALEGDRGRIVIRVAGRPADIALDRTRGRIAVPYLGLDRVDLWELPAP